MRHRDSWQRGNGTARQFSREAVGAALSQMSREGVRLRRDSWQRGNWTVRQLSREAVGVAVSQLSREAVRHREVGRGAMGQ